MVDAIVTIFKRVMFWVLMILLAPLFFCGLTAKLSRDSVLGGWRNANDLRAYLVAKKNAS
jgi:hypothetical protein